MIPSISCLLVVIVILLMALIDPHFLFVVLCVLGIAPLIMLCIAAATVIVERFSFD